MEGVTIEDAISISCETPLIRKSEIVSLDDAIDRILAIDIYSKVNDPRFDNSSMDGWAVRLEDCQNVGSKLIIIGTNQTGNYKSNTVKSGEACRIMTGAPMPYGADAIVIVEDSVIDGNFVIINGPARREYVRKCGENISIGQKSLLAGTLLTSSKISLSATIGYSELEVICKPKIAIISNGDELIEPGQKLLDGQIYESNSFGLAALVKKIGCEPVRLGIVHDNMEGLRKSLNFASKNCDAILTSGGVSMGEWDLVRKIMQEEGEIKFWKIKMRPGGPPLFGKWKKIPLFGLPGNPVSSHVVFTMVVFPWVSNSLGYDENQGPRLADRVSVISKSHIKGAPGKVCLRRIQINNEKGVLHADIKTHQGSGNINSMVVHNGLSLLPPDKDAKPGEEIEALWLR
ncbi:MAG: molybdopterin molybdenumtransferase MoeA [Marine Group II euryarchaeote MED-G38]|nr:molybdopterin molybdenumtransferase MoeA [Euryarchaeota archaeon]PDH23232.1 MAG: molybdopterin molybdenumtransferase MoeA [Marine Group II euryarchaeote MED-G38]|tara:strand:+ start:22243 stop:23448 length:1206 start_codon:yes stop_codon:yes gene_type:complete